MSIKSNPQDRVDALKVINGCNINYLDLDLTEEQTSIYKKVSNGLKEQNLYNSANDKMSDANLRARIRMIQYILWQIIWDT
ncbi:NAD synthase family protein [[Clostridium] sordellii ATCC 9714]|nr:NAD synthase family protein [[Clostridium] sordellii ATCC 9714] [Paeniclostridium sordellii ATCC 9714]